MQNNALVRIFAILFVLVSIYQLSFTFISSNQEKKAKIFAKESISDEGSNYLELRDKIESDYLDSVGQISLYGITSYNDAKNKELNKGLDLKGGINVILQISIKDILKGLAENTRNSTFNNSLSTIFSAFIMLILLFISSFIQRPFSVITAKYLLSLAKSFFKSKYKNFKFDEIL